MAERGLSESAIEAGAKFLASLDELGLQPEGAAWLYSYSLVDWRFAVVTSAVDIVGRRTIYRSLLDALRVAHLGDDLTEVDLYLVSPSDRWYSAMAAVLSTPPDAIIGKLFKENVVTDAFGAMAVTMFIYRISKSPSDDVLTKRFNRFATQARKAAEYAS